MRFAEAAGAWEALGAEPGPVAGPARAMAARARALALEPPAAPWDGVWVLTGK